MKINKDDWENLNYSRPCVFKFTSSWCHNCHILDQVIDDVKHNYNYVTWYEIDIDEEPEIAQHYGISTLPTLIFQNENTEDPIDMIYGLVSKHTLKSKIETNFVGF